MIARNVNYFREDPKRIAKLIIYSIYLFVIYKRFKISSEFFRDLFKSFFKWILVILRIRPSKSFF